MAVANGGFPFSQRDVVTEIYGDSSNRSLTELYSAAIGTFDPNYAGSKNSLYNFRNYQHIIPNGGYGRLYNYYALYDSRNIAPVGWHVPTNSEFTTLINNCGGFNNVATAQNLKEEGSLHWVSSNSSPNNQYGMSIVGGGFRDYDGKFGLIKEEAILAGVSCIAVFKSYLDITYLSFWATEYRDKTGNSVRLIKDDSTNTGIMTDNSGYTYKTVKIGNQVWMASNLRGTKYRNGDNIPVVTDNTAWMNLSTGACCSYSNNDAWSYDDNYVLPVDKGSISIIPRNILNTIDVISDTSVTSDINVNIDSYDQFNNYLGSFNVVIYTGNTVSTTINLADAHHNDIISVMPDTDADNNYYF